MLGDTSCFSSLFFLDGRRNVTKLFDGMPRSSSGKTFLLFVVRRIARKLLIDSSLGYTRKINRTEFKTYLHDI